jgi:hypothetical protein
VELSGRECVAEVGCTLSEVRGCWRQSPGAIRGFVIRGLRGDERQPISPLRGFAAPVEMTRVWSAGVCDGPLLVWFTTGGGASGIVLRPPFAPRRMGHSPVKNLSLCRGLQRVAVCSFLAMKQIFKMLSFVVIYGAYVAPRGPSTTFEQIKKVWQKESRL